MTRLSRVSSLLVSLVVAAVAITTNNEERRITGSRQAYPYREEELASLLAGVANSKSSRRRRRTATQTESRKLRIGRRRTADENHFSWTLEESHHEYDTEEHGVTTHDVETRKGTSETSSPLDFDEDGKDEEEDEEAATKSLETTFEADNGAFGVLFEIIAQDKPLAVTSLDFHTDLLESTRVEVYTKPGSFLGQELADTSGEWTTVTETAMTGNGKGEATSISRHDFREVKIPPGGRQSFYITLNTADLMYTDTSVEGSGNPTGGGGTDVGSIYDENDDMQLLVGVGVLGYPWGQTTTGPRMFNGRVHYRLPPTPVKSLVTSLKGDNGAFGSMFTVKAPASDISIQSIDFHTDLTDEVTVEVYTRPDSYIGYEMNAQEWTLVARDTVRGRGRGNPTPVPPEVFHPVFLSEGSTQAFYVTLTTRGLQYGSMDSDQDTAAPFVHNGDLEFFVGVGLAEYPFTGELFESRVFNGVIHYTHAEAPTSAPSIAPTSAPVIEDDGPRIDKSLESTFDEGNGSFGAMFDLKANQNITVRSLEFHTKLQKSTTVDVYTKRGTYIGFEDSKDEWDWIASHTVDGSGTGVGTVIPESAFDPVLIPGGEVQAFYVTLPTHDLLYTSVSGEVGDVYASTQDVEFLVGAGIGTEVFTETPSVYDRRVFNGVLHYSIKSELSPKGPVMTQQLISLVGLDAKESLQELNLDAFFGSTTKEFLTQAVQNQGRGDAITLDNVIVSNGVPEGLSQRRLQELQARKVVLQVNRGGGVPTRRRSKIVTSLRALQDLVDDDTVVPVEDDGGENTGTNSSTAAPTNDLSTAIANANAESSVAPSSEDTVGTSNGSSSTATDETQQEPTSGSENESPAEPQEDSDPNDSELGEAEVLPTYDVYVTITGEHNPPPYVDFGSVVEESFDEEGGQFVRALKEEDFFEEAVGVKAEQVSFDVPPLQEIQVQPKSPVNVLLVAVYGSCTAFFVVIILAISMVVRRHRKNRFQGHLPVSEPNAYCYDGDDHSGTVEDDEPQFHNGIGSHTRQYSEIGDMDKDGDGAYKAQYLAAKKGGGKGIPQVVTGQ